jgi:hypothetical protein
MIRSVAATTPITTPPSSANHSTSSNICSGVRGSRRLERIELRTRDRSNHHIVPRRSSDVRSPHVLIASETLWARGKRAARRMERLQQRETIEIVSSIGGNASTRFWSPDGHRHKPVKRREALYHEHRRRRWSTSASVREALALELVRRRPGTPIVVDALTPRAGTATRRPRRRRRSRCFARRARAKSFRSG